MHNYYNFLHIHSYLSVLNQVFPYSVRCLCVHFGVCSFRCFVCSLQCSCVHSSVCTFRWVRSVASGRHATVPEPASERPVVRRVVGAVGVATRSCLSRSPTETSGCINVTCAFVRLVGRFIEVVHRHGVDICVKPLD